MTDSTPPAVPEPRRFETMHTGTFHGREVRYRCLAGETHLEKAGKPHASVFSFAYLAEHDDPSVRPVTFLFNGGPGSASLWLHMGAFGPRRIVCPGDATPAGVAPYPIEDNALCSLDQSDLVFIDPPGTGYSRMLGEAKPEEAWGLEADAEIVADFIKAWLTANRRWASPRFLAGESYGTTRAVAVAGKLSSMLSGVALNGIALISVILDFHTARFQSGNPVADACYIPTYAMTALYHGKVRVKGGDRPLWLEEVRRFAWKDYLPALAAGTRLTEGERQSVTRKLASYVGLSEAWLGRARLKIEPARFRKELLRDQGRTVGRLDSRYVGVDFDGVGEMPDNDASSYAVDSAFVSAVNDHLTRRLGIDWDRPYVAFNRDALMQWDWHGPQRDDAPRWPGYVNVAPTLGRLLRENAGLRVLLANGYYDLATPFGAVEMTMAGNGIDMSRLTFAYYEAGHMMYLHEPSLRALVGDLRALVGG